jgi:hypothetical protein
VLYHRLTILGSFLLFWAAPLRAATVGLVQPLSETPVLTETLSRIHGELLSVGLEVKSIERPPNPSSEQSETRAWLQRLASEEQLDAVVSLVKDATAIAVDVWIIEKPPRRMTVSRIALDPNTRNAPERLAILAVEVLRSSFLEKDMMEARQRQQRGRVATTVTQPLPRVESSPTFRPEERVGFELGAAALTSFDGVGPAVLPIAVAYWKVRSWFVLQSAWAGMGTRPTISSADGSAEVGQQFGTFGGALQMDSRGPLQPSLGLALGALHTQVVGDAAFPRQGHRADQWSLLVDGSVGVQMRLSARTRLTMAAHWQLAQPYVAVYIGDKTVATTGRPNLVLTLTIGAWL